MSHRHLVARFITTAAGDPPPSYWPAPKVDWRHGWVLPHRAAEIEHFNSVHVNPFDEEPLDPGDYSTGILHHGEQRYAIEVSPMTDRDVWNWAIHRQVGPDANNPDHWKHMGGIPMGCFCGWGDNDWPDQRDHRFFGYEYPDDDDDDEAGGYETGRENAMIAGEDAFQEHIGGRRHSPHDYDRMVGDLDEPEGGYDIFGDRP